MTTSKRIALIFALTLSATLPTSADEVIKETATGGVNWSQGIVYAQGFGTAREGLSTPQKRILSRRAAIVDGQRNLLEITKGVRITSKVTTDSAMQESRETAARVEGIIKGAQPIKEHFQNDIYTVTMAMPISGEFLEVMYPEAAGPTSYNILPDRARQVAIVSMKRAGNWVIDLLVPRAHAAETIVIRSEQEADAYRRLVEWMSKGSVDNIDQVLIEAITNYETNSQYSGLLINASGVRNFELATIPNIRDEEGNVIYPGKETNYNDIVSKRGVTYDFDLADAIRNRRVATTPFTINAVSTYKNLASDLVISKQDADRVKQSPSTLEAMNKAGVLIVVAI